MHVSFLGGGNMAAALIGGLLSSGKAKAEDIRVSDVSADRRAWLEKTFGISTAEKNADVLPGADAVVLAVKPQQAFEVLDELKNVFRAEQLLLSICAGLPVARLEERTNARVVRAMPNLPALIGKGISAISGGSRTSEADLALAEAVLSGAGKVIRLPEDQMNAVTAISGSGPAFLFAYLEAVEAAGVEMGLSSDASAVLARETVSGAIQMVLAGEGTPAGLRERVSSKGGTTLAGLAAMQSAGFADAIRAGAFAAQKRAAELAG